MLSIRLKQGDDSKSLHLEQDLITIGRSAQSTIIIRNIKASRKHAKIERIGATYQVSDLESGNGTRVNGEKVSFQAIKVGDEIKIGDATLEILAIDEDASNETDAGVSLDTEDQIDLLPDEPKPADVASRETELDIRPPAAAKPKIRPKLTKPGPEKKK